MVLACNDVQHQQRTLSARSHSTHTMCAHPYPLSLCLAGFHQGKTHKASTNSLFLICKIQLGIADTPLRWLLDTGTAVFPCDSPSLSNLVYMTCKPRTRVPFCWCQRKNQADKKCTQNSLFRGHWEEDQLYRMVDSFSFLCLDHSAYNYSETHAFCE